MRKIGKLQFINGKWVFVDDEMKKIGRIENKKFIPEAQPEARPETRPEAQIAQDNTQDKNISRLKSLQQKRANLGMVKLEDIQPQEPKKIQPSIGGVAKEIPSSFMDTLTLGGYSRAKRGVQTFRQSLKEKSIAPVKEYFKKEVVDPFKREEFGYSDRTAELSKIKQEREFTPEEKKEYTEDIARRNIEMTIGMMGGANKISKNLSKIKDIKKVKSMVKGIGLSDDAIKSISKTTDVKKIEGLLNPTKVTKIEPLTKQVTKAKAEGKSFDEFINEQPVGGSARANGMGEGFWVHKQISPISSSNKTVKVFRGISEKFDDLVDGDFVTKNKGLASAHAGSSRVKEFDLPEKHLYKLGDRGIVYYTGKTKSQLKDIWDKSTKTSGVEDIVPTTKPVLPEKKLGEVVPSNQVSNRKAQLPTSQELRGSLPKGSSKLKEPQGLKQPAKDVLELEKSFEKISGLSKIGKKKPSVKGDIIEDTKDYTHKLYTEAIDKFHPLIRAGQKAGRKDKIIRALTGHYGVGSTAEYHLGFQLKPILKNVDANHLRDFTIASRDIELGARGIKGSNIEAGKQVLDKLKNQLGNKQYLKLKNTATKLYKYQKDIIQTYLVDTGVISKEGASAMFKKNEKYIPFQRVMDDMDEFLGVSKRAVASLSSQDLVKGIKGSKRKIIDPLQSVVDNTYKAISLGRKNEAAKAIINLKNKLPNEIKAIKKMPFGQAQNKTISFLQNGKRKIYQVPQDIAEAAKGLEEESLNALTKILAVPARIVRTTATGANPGFALPNIARDIMTAFVNTGTNPLAFTQGLASFLGKTKTYQTFLKAGGKTSRLSLDRPYIERTVKELSRGKKNIGAYIPKTPRDFLNIIESVGEASEQATRIATFKRMLNKGLKKGLSEEKALRDAAFWAQDSTVNFARKGSKTKSVSALIAFLNARVQGTDRIIKSIKDNPVGATTRLAMISQVPAVLAYMWNRQFESFNDERIISENTKDRNFIFMLSDKPLKLLGGTQYITIPKGEIGRFANPTEQFLRYLDGEEDTNAFAQIGGAFKTISPVEKPSDLIPTAFKPIIENISNYDFFYENQIVPEYKKDYPSEYQTASYTPELYNIAGKLLKMSPSKIDNIMSGYFTGAEKLVSAGYEKFMSRDKMKIGETPVIRRFLGGAKKTEAEFERSRTGKMGAAFYDIQDVKSGIQRGDIPQDEGDERIREILENNITPEMKKLLELTGEEKEEALNKLSEEKYRTFRDIEKIQKGTKIKQPTSKERAKEIYQELKDLPADTAEYQAKMMIRDDEAVGNALRNIIKEEKLGLTNIERTTKGLNIDERTAEVKNILSELEGLEKKEKLQDYYDKKILTEGVIRQFIEEDNKAVTDFLTSQRYSDLSSGLKGLQKQAVYEKLKKTPKAEVTKIMARMKDSEYNLWKGINQLVKEDKLNMTDEEKKIKDASYRPRARLMADNMRGMSSAERTNYLKRMTEIGAIPKTKRSKNEVMDYINNYLK